MLIMMLFWIMLTIGIVLLVKWFIDQNKGQSETKEVTAMEAAQLRYARGEISREEFEEIRRNLEE
ncbi:SHOCT domain-containing protein [Methanolobus chelungpuianus]|nr:SHOCT domain-containing protein [Methanolobus chelungpuianus]